jgi:hypothetical protein
MSLQIEFTTNRRGKRSSRRLLLLPLIMIIILLFGDFISWKSHEATRGKEAFKIYSYWAGCRNQPFNEVRAGSSLKFLA